MKAVDRLLEVRRFKRVTLEDVRRLTRGVARMQPFLIADDWSPGALTDRSDLRERMAPAPRQLSLF